MTSLSTMRTTVLSLSLLAATAGFAPVFAAGHESTDAPAATSAPTGQSLGVVVTDLPFEALAERKLEQGVRVMRVMPGSLAAGAGIKNGDIIVELGGRPVYSAARLQYLVRDTKMGDGVEVKLQRDGSMQTLMAKAPAAPPPKAMAARGPAFLGVQMQPMTPQLQQAFEAPAGAGVLVVRVAEESAAEKAGIAVGDVLVSLDGTPIRRPQDVLSTLRQRRAGDPVAVEVIRDKASKTLNAELGVAPAPRMGARNPHGGMGPHHGMGHGHGKGHGKGMGKGCPHHGYGHHGKGHGGGSGMGCPHHGMGHGKGHGKGHGMGHGYGMKGDHHGQKGHHGKHHGTCPHSQKSKGQTSEGMKSS